MNELPISKMDGALTVKEWSREKIIYQIPHKYILCFSRVGDKWEWYLLKDAVEVHDSKTYIGNIYFVGTVLGSSSILFRSGVNSHVFNPYPSAVETYPGGPLRKLYFGNDLLELIGDHFDEIL